MNLKRLVYCGSSAAHAHCDHESLLHRMSMNKFFTSRSKKCKLLKDELEKEEYSHKHLQLQLFVDLQNALQQRIDRRYSKPNVCIFKNMQHTMLMLRTKALKDEMVKMKRREINSNATYGLKFKMILLPNAEDACESSDEDDNRKKEKDTRTPDPNLALEHSAGMDVFKHHLMTLMKQEDVRTLKDEALEHLQFDVADVLTPESARRTAHTYAQDDDSADVLTLLNDVIKQHDDVIDDMHRLRRCATHDHDHDDIRIEDNKPLHVLKTSDEDDKHDVNQHKDEEATSTKPSTTDADANTSSSAHVYKTSSIMDTFPIDDDAKCDDMFVLEANTNTPNTSPPHAHAASTKHLVLDASARMSFASLRRLK